MNRPDHPIAGFYKRRLTKGGPFVGAVIFYPCPFYFENGEMTVERSRPLLCRVNGEWRDVLDQWTWLCGQPISEAEFLYLLALAEHAAAYEPDLPEANPRAKIDRLTVPAPVW